jgi:hypothetical protein
MTPVIIGLLVLFILLFATLLVVSKRKRKSVDVVEPEPPHSLEEWRLRAKASQDRSNHRRQK